jgi:23S rRNA (uridine2552-2'-O)-methyltransferase
VAGGRPAVSTKSGSGVRNLKQRVKTANKRSLSSQKWLERQLNDPYVARAKREGYRSRAAFKLLEIDEKFHILKPGQKIVDLGAAPGGWSQIAAKKVGPKGRIVGIDLLPIDPMAGVEFIQLDFLDESAPGKLVEMLGGPADLVMSDMAANTTGHKKTDHLRIIGLAEAAIYFAREILAPGGAFVAKVFQGGTENQLLGDLKRDFAVVRHVKPSASRADSAELYVLATGFRGAAGQTPSP